MGTHRTRMSVEVVLHHLPKALPAPSGIGGEDSLNTVGPLFVPARVLPLHQLAYITHRLLDLSHLFAHGPVHAGNIRRVAPIVVDLGVLRL